MVKRKKRVKGGGERDDSPHTPPRRNRRGKSAGRGSGSGGGNWYFGTHAVNSIINNTNRNCLRLLVTDEARPNLRLDNTEHLTISPEIVSRPDLDALLPRGAVHQGIAVQAPPLEETGLDEACLPLEDSGNVVLALDHVTDPQNVGAILRSAAAFGARALVMTDRHAPPVTGALAKAASGALEIVPIVRVVNLARALDQLADWGYWRVGLDGNAPATLADANPGRNVVLILGAEGSGLRRLTRERCDIVAKLPITDAVESLNVSAAAAVALYEMIRA